MTLTIDNFDNLGPVDYSSWLDSETPPCVRRRLNAPSEMSFALVAAQPDFVVPASGARVRLARSNGSVLFTGYLTSAPDYEYLGWAQSGPAYRYLLIAAGDEALLDHKPLPQRSPFVARPAGDIITQLAQDALPDTLDCSSVQPLDALPSFASDTRKTWSQHAADLALRARASYRLLDGKLIFEPLGARQHSLSESDPGFSPDSLKLAGVPHPTQFWLGGGSPGGGFLNDLTVSGHKEPHLYVKDYFLGDGLTLSFNLSHVPPHFSTLTEYLVDDEFEGTALDPHYWNFTDPLGTISVSGGALQIQGGTGQDGQTTVSFVEQLELGGALTLRHGQVSFSAASDAVIGGLYNGSSSIANCLAGFRVTPAGSQSNIKPLINGVAIGAGITTIAGHRYALTTRIYATQIFRRQQLFHSSLHPAGQARGGTPIPADVRVVLEVHDIDPSNPGSLAAISTVLYDDVISAAPAYCSYVLVNSLSLNASISYAQLLRVPEAEVRSALPTAAFRTRLLGALADGCECALSGSGSLLFFPAYVPAPNECITVCYRSRALATARVSDAVAAANLARGPDGGIRSGVRKIKDPATRTASECELANLALLDDSCQKPWSGEYQKSVGCPTQAGFAWVGVFADDVFPGDSISVNLPSRSANFTAIIREVDVTLADLATERSHYTVRFANDSAAPLSFTFESATAHPLHDSITPAQVGASTIADLPAAEITSTTSTSVTIDAGCDPSAGGGIEVRRADHGWNASDDRNLVGRFTTRTFTVPRLSRAQDYYLRQYDASSPRLYSRYSTALHLDYPY